MLANGEIVTIGSPAELTSVRPEATIRYRRGGEDVVLTTEEPGRVLHDLYEAEGEPEGLEVRRASLEEIYLDLTEGEE